MQYVTSSLGEDNIWYLTQYRIFSQYTTTARVVYGSTFWRYYRLLLQPHCNTSSVSNSLEKISGITTHYSHRQPDFAGTLFHSGKSEEVEPSARDAACHYKWKCNASTQLLCQVSRWEQRQRWILHRRNTLSTLISSWGLCSSYTTTN